LEIQIQQFGNPKTTQTTIHQAQNRYNYIYSIFERLFGIPAWIGRIDNEKEFCVVDSQRHGQMEEKWKIWDFEIQGI